MMASDKPQIEKNYEGQVENSAFGRIFSFREFKSLSKIAWPLILSSLVTMSVSITDVIMIGKLGTLELAAAAAASDFYSVFFYLAAGVAAAISPMISQARGKRQFREIKTIWIQGFITSAMMWVPAAFAVYHAPSMLSFIGVEQNIVATGAPYAHMMAITLFPMLALSVMHYFLSAVNRTRIILYVTAVSLPVNILGNYLFLYGSWGFPDLGLAGAGLASAITACFMFGSLLCYVLWQPEIRRYLKFPIVKHKSRELRKEIIRIGLPIGVSHFGEMGVFLFATVTMGIFGAEVLAAHTIALRMAGVFYALPIGYAQAAMVRIGYLHGRNEHARVNVAIKTILGFAFVAGLVMLVLITILRQDITGAFISEGQMTEVVIAQSSLFLMMLALMQPTVIVGTIGAGVLRGFKDSTVPMYYSLICYWGLGFIGALILALIVGMGGLGMWIGLLTATAAFAVLVAGRIYTLRSTEPQTLSLVKGIV